MEYKYVPYDPNHYATDLQKNYKSNHLDWDSSPGQNVLILQTPYGVKATDIQESITGNTLSIIESVCSELPHIEWSEDSYTEVFPGVWIRFVTAASKVRLKGCPLHGEACTYSVLAYEQEGDVCTIYTPRDQAMISPFCDIAMEVHVDIIKEKATEKKILRRTVVVETGFYILSFPERMADVYINGSMSVRVNGVEIPVTKEMLEIGTVYIQAPMRPEIAAKNKGLKII